MRIFTAIKPVWTTIYYSILLILVVLFLGKAGRWGVGEGGGGVGRGRKRERRRRWVVA